MLALLLCLFAVALAHDTRIPVDSVELHLQALPDAGGQLPELSKDGRALLLSGGRQQQAAARLRFTLPETSADSARWVIWMERRMVDGVELQRGEWRSGSLDFFRPLEGEGAMPAGFVVPLPGGWQGPVVLDLHARGEVRTELRPQLMREDVAMRMEQRGIAISSVIYASLFTLTLLALALFSAAQDRAFLAFFGCTVVMMLGLSAFNGHLYQMHGFDWLARWRSQGLLAFGFLLAAAVLQMLQHYAGTRAARPAAAPIIDAISAALVLLAALSLLDLSMLLPWLQPAWMLAWVGCGVGSLLLLADAARRRVPMAWPILLLALLTLAMALLAEFMARGLAIDSTWSRYGFQLCLVASTAILAVGLISRISQYRDQRDRERLARADSEKRMRREAARGEFNAALQAQLHATTEVGIEWAACQMMLEHLMPQLGVGEAVVMLHGYHGQDLFIALPATRRHHAEQAVGKRMLALKRHAANGIPLQQPVMVSGAQQAAVAMEAIVPLPVRAPAWGTLLLERAGGDGFSNEDLALAGEFARLALQHVEQARVAINLRRSAEMDALTGLFNRRTIDQWLVRSFSQSEREAQPLSVLFLDMDHFKSINDRFGHACGDLCLSRTAAVLRGSVGEDGMLGRYGGEEFIVILPGRGGAAARVVADQLRLDIERLVVEWEGQPIRLTVSVGLATRLDSERDHHETIDRADKALYAAKRGGRNCVQVAPAVFS